MVDIAGSRTLPDLLDEQAAIRLDAPYLTVEAADGGCVTLSYREVAAQTRRIAGGFAALGVRPGDAVLVHLPNSVEFVLAWFALARLGAVMVPAHTAHTAREIGYAAQRAGARAAVTRAATVGILVEATDGLLPPTRIVTVGAVAGHPAFAGLADHPPSGHRPRPDDVQEIIFTSGTTAAPKGVELTHAHAVRSGLQIALSLQLTPEDVCLSSLPAFHVNAQSSTLLAALSAGAHAVLLEVYSASRYVGQLVAHGATITSLVAMQVRTLVRQPASAQDREHRVRAVFYAINVTDVEFAEFEQRYGMRLLNGYGLSEAYTAVTIAPLHGERRWPSIGRPLLDREVRIVDEVGEPVPPGTVGEITVRGTPGRTIFRGYLGDPAATAAALRGEWLHTGDLGRADQDGLLYFVDRKKDMVKRGGENVSAAEVEVVLLEHPAVTEAAVIGVPDEVRDESIVAFVAVADPAVGPDELVEHCRGRLAPFKVPSAVVIRDELPKTSIGKIEKKALRAEGVPG